MTRKCSSCDKIITYKTSTTHRIALLYNKPCRSCAAKNHKFSDSHKTNISIARKKQSFLMKGDLNFAKRLDVRLKISKNNPMKNPIHRTTQKNGFSQELRMKRSVAAKLRWDSMDSSARKKFIEKRIDIYTKKLASGEIKIKTNWKTGYFVKRDGSMEWYDSSLELSKMEELENSGVVWTKKHKIRIPYVNKNGINTYYIPDFLINNSEICEMKGWLKDEDIVKAKIAIDFCQNMGFTYTFILGKNLIKELSYEP